MISGWQAWYWIGGIGIAGAIAALCFYVPALLVPIVRFLKLMMGTRIGCVVIAVIVTAIVVDYLRHAHDDKVFAAKTAAFEQAQKDRDARIAADTRTLVEREKAEQFIAEQDAKKDVEGFKASLPPNRLFRVGTDAARLRALAGLPPSQRHRRVPKAPRKGRAAGHH